MHVTIYLLKVSCVKFNEKQQPVHVMRDVTVLCILKLQRLKKEGEDRPETQLILCIKFKVNLQLDAGMDEGWTIPPPCGPNPMI
jgi:hypothetical protein